MKTAKGISLLGAAFSAAIIIITQLVVTTMIDAFGLFGNPQIKVDFTKPLGILVMIAGMIIFKFHNPPQKYHQEFCPMPCKWQCTD